MIALALLLMTSSFTAAAEERPAVLDAHALRTLELDLLGRPPLRDERERWLGQPISAVTETITDGREFWDRWFEEQLYYFLLVSNFRPRAERVLAIPAEMAAHKLDVRDAIHLIALSANFDQRNPGADTFVTVVMEQLAGLEVQKNLRDLEIGKKIYDGAEGVFLGVPGKSQADVVKIAIAGKTFARHFVAREYDRLLHGKLETKEWTACSEKLQRDPSSYVDLVRDWIASDAYRARLAKPIPQSNRVFVRSLFVDLFDRVPTAEEAEPMRQALDGLSDPAPLRSILVRMMLDSGRVKLEKRDEIREPAAWVNALFLRLLGREPGEEELSTFVQTLQDPACRTSTILCAIMSSPEYQQY